MAALADATSLPRTGARVRVGGDVATVRYVGAVAGAAAGTLWCGVEWDAPGRGRHDGQPDVAGPRYFACPYGWGGHRRARAPAFLADVRTR